MRNERIIVKSKLEKIADKLTDKLMKYGFIDFSLYEISCRVEQDIKDVLLDNGVYNIELLNKLYLVIGVYQELDLDYVGSYEWLKKNFEKVLNEWFDVIDDNIPAGEPGISY